MLFFYVVCLLQFHITLSQFHDHFDFQKEGEVFIKGQKFNVLKLSKHMVRDYFLNFMQKRDDQPTKKVFIDKNGLRHFWSGINDDKNLRKSEGDVPALEDFRNAEVIISENVEDVVDKEPKKEEKEHNNDDKTKDGDGGRKNEVNSVLKPKRKPKEVVVDKVIMKPALRTDAEGKTMAITYFYCPFFGVMSLSAYVD